METGKEKPGKKKTIQIPEMDKLYTFIKKPKNPEGIRYLAERIWTAVDRSIGNIIAFRVGNESVSNAVSMIYEILSGNRPGEMKSNDNLSNTTINYLCTDGHLGYDVIAKHNLFRDSIKHHVISKAEKCLVESLSSSMRDRLARPERRSKAYSKSTNMLELSIGPGIHRKKIFNNIEKYCILTSEDLVNVRLAS